VPGHVIFPIINHVGGEKVSDGLIYQKSFYPTKQGFGWQNDKPRIIWKLEPLKQFVRSFILH